MCLRTEEAQAAKGLAAPAAEPEAPSAAAAPKRGTAACGGDTMPNQRRQSQCSLPYRVCVAGRVVV